MARDGLRPVMFCRMYYFTQAIFSFLQLPDGGVRWHMLNLDEIAKIQEAAHRVAAPVTYCKKINHTNSF